MKLKPLNISKLIAIFVSLSGIIVIIGWVFDITVLKSILPIWVTMKSTTAVSFFFSGIILYHTSNKINTDYAQVILSFSILIILLLMVTLLLSSFFDITTGVEAFIVTEKEDAIQTISPGRPSIGTMVNFILISLLGFVKLNHLKNGHKIIATSSSIIFVIAFIAVLGYMFSIPFMYFNIENYSTAMAIHTAILFITIGIGFLRLRQTAMFLNSKLEMFLCKKNFS